MLRDTGMLDFGGPSGIVESSCPLSVQKLGDLLEHRFLDFPVPENVHFQQASTGGWHSLSGHCTLRSRVVNQCPPFTGDSPEAESQLGLQIDLNTLSLLKLCKLVCLLSVSVFCSVKLYYSLCT